MRKENINARIHRSEEKHIGSNAPEEPICAHVLGPMAQSATPRSCVPQQVPTPPNTLVEKKKDRPLSWDDVSEELRKKAKCAVDDGNLQEAMAPQKELRPVYTTSRTPQSATTSFHDADEYSMEERILAGEAALSPDCSDTTSGDTNDDDPSTSDEDFGSANSHGNTIFVDSVRSADFNGQMVVGTASGNDSGTTAPLGYPDSENNITSKAIDPQLPMRKVSELNGVAPHSSSTTADLSTTSDHCSPVLDDIALDTSSDYDGFLDDVTVVDSVPANCPRTKPQLCREQLALVDLITNGQNVFYTGSAGCGKSTVLKHLVTLLRRERKRVDIVAPTGRAALEVNGRTLYNYAGWVPHSLSQPLSILKSNARGKKVWQRLKATDVLIIDEISMVANLVFERLNCIMKAARGSEKPFGGVQLIVTGDFCQLPPVNGFEYCLDCGTALGSVSWDGVYQCVRCPSQFEEIDKWAFRSAAWRECEFKHVNLKVIHRQKDAVLKALLEKRRLGLPYSPHEKSLLMNHPSETRDAVRLFPKREEVKRTNDKELSKLSTRALTYTCVDN